MTDITLEDIKDEVHIEDVLLACGAIVQEALWGSNEVPLYCPFHPNVNTPAASMNKMRGVFYCYSCGAGGSVIDAALLHLETDSIAEAKAWLIEEFLS